MEFKTKTIAGSVEILASKDFQAIPVTVTGTAVVKAGMPLKLLAPTVDGTVSAVAAGTGANGILLYDVDPTVNQNAAMVVSGIVDWTKCKAHSGATATGATMATILPAITFRENIGVNTAEDTEDDDNSGQTT